MASEEIFIPPEPVEVDDNILSANPSTQPLGAASPPTIPPSAYDYLNWRLQENYRSNRSTGSLLIFLGMGMLLPMPFGVRFDVWADLAKRPVTDTGSIWLRSGLSAAKTAGIVSLGWGFFALLAGAAELEAAVVGFCVGLVFFVPLCGIGALWAAIAACSVLSEARQQGYC